MKKPRKPRDIPGVTLIDMYWEQFAETTDLPKIRIRIEEQWYGAEGATSNDMRKLAAWLLKAADWLEARENDK